MKICHVVYDCDPMRHTGGISKIVLQLSSAQSKLGHQVRIMTIGREEQPHVEPVGAVTIERFPPTRKWRSHHSRALSAALRERPAPDVIHTHNTFLPLNQTSFGASRRLRVPLVVTPHGALDPELIGAPTLKGRKKRLYVRAREGRVIRGSDALIVNTEAEAGWIRSLGRRDRIYVVANGIPKADTPSARDVEDFRRRWHLSPTTPTLLFIGRLVPKKGIHDIIAALTEVREAHPDAVLLLGGDRTEDPAYTRRIDADIEQARVTDSVRWLGFLDESAKPAAYANASLFVHASISEGMPMAVLEAMGAGVPCLVTPGTMLTALAEKGAVVETEASTLGARAVEMITSPAHMAELARRGSQLASASYSWAAVAASTCAIYERARR